MSTKQIIICVVLAVVAIIGLGVMSKCIGIVDSQEWVFVQPYWGDARIQNGSGMYWKGMADTWPYDRYMELVYDDEKGSGDKEKDAIKVTFNDGSEAWFAAFIVIATPNQAADQMEFHKMMNGNPAQIKSKVKAHLTECMKVTAPLMSSTEHQVSRKSEYSQLVEQQLSLGVYDMKQIRKTLPDRVDEQGNPVTLAATEILRDNTGKPIIAKKSPLTEDYKLEITQFSIKGTRYDPETLKQFSAKKKQFLAAEQSKAGREAMVQEALKIKAEGLRDKASAEAKANVTMATAVIAAELKANVALQDKKAAETKAAQALSVAKTEKATLLMTESATYEQAVIRAATADELKKAMIAQAEGKKQAIELSGDITELEEAQIRAEVDKAIGVAKALAGINVPSTMIVAGGGGDGSSITDHLVNIKLMESTGLFDKMNINKTAVTRKVSRPAKK